MADKAQSYQELVNRVRQFNAERVKAASGDSEAVHKLKDPAEQGAPSNPKGSDRPEESNSAQNLPANAKNDGTVAGTAETKELDARGALERPHGSTNGDAKDQKATSPTDPLSKIAASANKAKAIADRVRSLKSEKSAAAPQQVAASNDQLASDIQMTDAFHMKLASFVLQNEDLVRATERALARAAGEREAQNLIKSAMDQQAQFEELALLAQQEEMYKAAAAQQAMQAEQQLAGVINYIEKNASEADIAEMTKLAAVHNANLSKIEDPIEKAAYMQGAEDGAAMMDAEEGAEGAEGLPGAGEEASIEDVIQVLDEAVQSGEIDEETAAGVVQELVQGGEGAAPEGEVAPEEAAPEEVKKASALAAYLNA